MRILQHFRADIRETQRARGALNEANAERLFEFGDAPAHGRGRHLETPRGLREAVGVHDMGEDDQRIQIRHRDSSSGISFPLQPNYRRRNPYCRLTTSITAWEPWRMGMWDNYT